MNPRPNAAAAAAKYRGVAVATCSPSQLLIMLFDGAVRFIGEASEAMVKRDRARAGERIGKALAIIEELSATLDQSQAPELCENLFALYAFCRQHLMEANLLQDPQKLREVATILGPLRESFAIAAGVAAATAA